jgi:hypothetical protein
MSATTLFDPVAYRDAMANHGADVWPNAGQALLDELAAARGRFALVAASPSDADDLVERLHLDLLLGVARLGPALASLKQPPSIAEIERACDGATVITDLDALMWPDMHVSPLQLLTTLARHRPTIAIWPGNISRGRATYSATGRPDHYDITLHDVIVLRPRFTRFPDEVPFTIERILQ